LRIGVPVSACSAATAYRFEKDPRLPVRQRRRPDPLTGLFETEVVPMGDDPARTPCFPARLDAIAQGKAHGEPLEIWFCDEAQVGQKRKFTSS
jgi:hypothetical protein